MEMKDRPNRDGVSIELGQIVWGEPKTEPIIETDPETGDVKVSYLHTWGAEQDVRTVPPTYPTIFRSDSTDVDGETVWDVMSRPYMGTRDPMTPQQEEILQRLKDAFAKLSDAMVNAYGPLEELLAAAERLPDDDGTVYVVRHDGPNRRQRRNAKFGRPDDTDPEHYANPGRLAFGKRERY